MFYGMHLVASHVFSASRIIIWINKYVPFGMHSKRILGSINQLLHGKCRYTCAGSIDLSIKLSVSRIKRKNENYRLCISWINRLSTGTSTDGLRSSKEDWILLYSEQ